MKIEPLFDRVVLKAVEQEAVTSSGIILGANESQERPFVYEVVAVGPGKPDRDMSSVKVGDRVLAGQYSGDEVKLGDAEYKVVAIEYILGKIV